MRKKKVKVSDNKMNVFQCTVNSVLTRLKKKEISRFSINENNPLIKIKVILPQGKSKKFTLDATKSNINFNEVRKVINQKIL